MTDQNSGVDYQIRPEDLQEELGIKKDAYYAYIKFLGLKIEKADGKAFLSQEQADLMRSLRSHVLATGKMDGFSNSNGGELTTVESASLTDNAPPDVQEIPVGQSDDELNQLFRAAAELKGQRLVTPQLVISALADKLTYEDLPDDVKQQVDAVRQSTSPKPPSQIADQLLSRYRSQKLATA
ncbi:hypothetical protein ACKFKG_23495 [Phormidesmis sp. 146-35]